MRSVHYAIDMYQVGSDLATPERPASVNTHPTNTHRHGVEVRHLWGMTELSPLGTLGEPKPAALGGRQRPAGGFGPGARGGGGGGGKGDVELTPAQKAHRDAYISAKLKQGRPHVLCESGEGLVLLAWGRTQVVAILRCHCRVRGVD